MASTAGKSEHMTNIRMGYKSAEGFVSSGVGVLDTDALSEFIGGNFIRFHDVSGNPIEGKLITFVVNGSELSDILVEEAP